MGLIPLAPLTKTRAVAFATLGFGALAQLGERLHGMQEVSGSIPLCSTKTLSSRLISQHSQQRTGADLTHKNVRTVQRFDPAMLHQNPFITIDLPALPTAHRR